MLLISKMHVDYINGAIETEINGIHIQEIA